MLQEIVTTTKLEQLSWYLVEICLIKCIMVKYCPFHLATSIVYTTQKTFTRESNWGFSLQQHFGYNECQHKYVTSNPLGVYFINHWVVLLLMMFISKPITCILLTHYVTLHILNDLWQGMCNDDDNFPKQDMHWKFNNGAQNILKF